MDSATRSLQALRRKVTLMPVVAICVLVLLYLFTRLTHILALPIFSDEGIYINWARTAAHDPAWRFISLIDGKQPLQTWGTIPFIKLFPDNLLLAGRLFSVTTGSIALVGMIILCGYLWGRRAAILGGLLYIACPFFLFYDRMALVDSGVNAAVIWIFFFSILLAQRLRLDIAIIFGVIAGFGLLTKSSIALFLSVSVFAVVFTLTFNKPIGGTVALLRLIRHQWIRWMDFLLLFGVSSGIAISMYMTQKFFSPFFHYIAQKNLTFILSPSEWLRDPLALVATNIRLLPLYVAWESGWIPVILGTIGIVMLSRSNKRLATYLSLWIIIPAILIVNFNKVLFPRYLIFFPTFFILGTVYLLSQIRSRGIFVLILGSSLVVFTVLGYPIIFDVKSISLPPVDRGQYIEGSTAVWGVDDLMGRVRSATTDGRYALVLAEGNFGLIADVLSVYVKPHDRIEIRGEWPLNEEHILKAQEETMMKHVFVVFSHRTDFPVHWREIMDVVAVYDKPENTIDKVYLFRLRPPQTGTRMDGAE